MLVWRKNRSVYACERLVSPLMLGQKGAEQASPAPEDVWGGT